ncbi:non-canonical poly(A) RNA polymerase protein Trf4-1 [Drosophila busckii]|uniref:non-canonical poly(A) RNA polymerase protein Trf4-1 n=1 Tax=Drosophila busckii TaxID=30019 RepID=UPI001432EF90|nr:non-canonical poly(A) RNA polymerase protein Trf4-1 [Drosophila busckii]
MSKTKYGGAPWRQRDYNYGEGIIGLHEEIEHFSQYILPTPVEHGVRNDLVKRCASVVNALWPEAVVEIFGSFRTGLFLPSADIDLVVLGRWDRLPLRTLEAELVSCGIAESSSIRVLDMAAVPIIKFTDRLSKIKVDLSFNIANGVQSAELIKMFKRDFPGLGNLVLVLKQFLLQRGLNEVFTGGISSYSLILMCISFLQLHPRNNFHSNINLGVLLLEFFELYGLRFNYAQLGISIRNGGSYVLQRIRSPLCIEDPLQPSNDIGRNSFGIVAIKQAFQFGYRVLSQAVNPANNVACNESILGRIIFISDEVIDYRAWLSEQFAHLIVIESISPLSAQITSTASYIIKPNGNVEQPKPLPLILQPNQLPPKQMDKLCNSEAFILLANNNS